MRETETKYSVISSDKFAVPPMIRGGVTTPANIDNECWNPKMNPNTIGMSEFNPKNGWVLGTFLEKGMSGTNKYL